MRLKHLASMVALLMMFAVISIARQSFQDNGGKSPQPSPRRKLPKPPSGARGFEQYAGRDASSRLIAVGGSRGVRPPPRPTEKEIEEQRLFAQISERGSKLYDEGHYKEAIEAFQQAVNLRPTSADVYVKLAETYVKLQQPEEAHSVAKKALILSNSLAIRNQVGDLFMDLKSFTEAIEVYEGTIRINESDVGRERVARYNLDLSPDYYNLGLAYVGVKKFPEAISAFKKAVLVNPNYLEAQYNLGLALLAVGDRTAAQKQLITLNALDKEWASQFRAILTKH